MKFDCIILNPPYFRNMHLNILEESRKHISSNGCCVCLHPTYQYTTKRIVFEKNSLKKTKYNDFTYCKEIETLSEKGFDACLWTKIGISVWDNNIYDNSYDRFTTISNLEKNIIKKIKQKIDISNLKQFKYNENKKTNFKYVLIMPSLHGHIGQSDFYYLQSMTYEKAITTKRSKGLHAEIPFETDEERYNFYNSLFLKIMLYTISLWKTDMHIYINFIPWLKDYKEKWTNERLKDYFELTDEEYNFILNKKLN